MLRPEMNLPERSEFSSQALLLIRFQILYFSQIPERNKDPTSHISVLFYSELLNISGISEPEFISANPNSLPVLTVDNLQPFQQKIIIQYDFSSAERYNLLCQASGCYDSYVPFQFFT